MEQKKKRIEESLIFVIKSRLKARTLFKSSTLYVLPERLVSRKAISNFEHRNNSRIAFVSLSNLNGGKVPCLWEQEASRYRRIRDPSSPQNRVQSVRKVVETLASHGQVCSVKFQVAYITWPEQHVSARSRKLFLFPMARQPRPPILASSRRFIDSRRGTAAYSPEWTLGPLTRLG